MVKSESPHLPKSIVLDADYALPQICSVIFSLTVTEDSPRIAS